MINQDPHANREAEKYEQPIVSREFLLSLLEQSETPLTFKGFCQRLKYDEEFQLIGLKRRLRAMENAGQIQFNKFKQYVLPPHNNKLIGRVIGHRDGFGFFVNQSIDNTLSSEKGKDLYISSHEMQRVFHGDIVEAILVDRTDRKGRQEIRILDVVEPRKAGIVGRFYVDHHICSIVPDDARIKHEILIDPSERLGARHGQMVVVEVIKRPTKRANAVGKVIEVLGEHMAPGMEIQIALREHDLPHQFPAQVLADVAVIPDEVEELSKNDRVDLRQLPLITIDGEDARDFDDAVYCQPKKGGGWRLWVAIADVSYYVQPNTPLDTEAISRGNSVYFPSQVIPMLPEKLSNGLCSLNPHVDRLCMVSEITLSAKGKVTSSQFYSAVMNSKARFTYTKVAAILDWDEKTRQEFCDLVPDIENLKKMYTVLAKARDERGAIAFETQEPKFIFNEDKKIARIDVLVRNDAHKIIEECMILANVCAAKFIEKHEMPSLYRVHDKPSVEKYQNFVSYLKELGINLSFLAHDQEQPEPMDYAQILEQIKGRPDQELIQTLLLRSMRQAVYQSENLGHFGLALTSYTHFTSPIRRYPDLIVHRVIKAILQKQAQAAQENTRANEGFYAYDVESVVHLGEHCSYTERRADEATRDVADWLKCEYMQDHIGDVFEGVISTVTNFGLFVRLKNLHIEGLIHITALGRDYYHYDDIRMCLTGENTGVKYRVGDEIEIQVAAVNLDEKKIDFAITESLTTTFTQRKKTNPKNAGKKPNKNGAAKAVVKEKKPRSVTKKIAEKKTKATKKKTAKKRLGKNARKAKKTNNTL